jgi:hypothetical protein
MEKKQKVAWGKLKIILKNYLISDQLVWEAKIVNFIEYSDGLTHEKI